MAIAYFDPKIARVSRLLEVLEGAVSIYGRGLHFSAFHYSCNLIFQTYCHRYSTVVMGSKLMLAFPHNLVI